MAMIAKKAAILLGLLLSTTPLAWGQKDISGKKVPVRPPVRRAPTVQDNQNQLDSNEALFTVMAAINAAGYDAQADAISNSPFRRTLRTELGSKKLDSIVALNRFFRDHQQKDPNAELSQYISYSLLINGPPSF